MDSSHPQSTDHEWLPFPGGELEGRRPKILCPACREKAARALSKESASGTAQGRTLCFHCYRAELDRRRGSKAYLPVQSALPFEPVNLPRLKRLKAERVAERARLAGGSGQYADRLRKAQIAARRALQSLESAVGAGRPASADRQQKVATAIHAAELQLPASWIPFVVSR